MNLYFLLSALVVFAGNNDLDAVAKADAKCEDSCDKCVNLNFASQTELDKNIDYVSWGVAAQIISLRPICSKEGLVTDINGLTPERIEEWECVVAECNPYTEGHWDYSEFSECSSKCDSSDMPPTIGVRTRTAKCVDKDGKEGTKVLCREKDRETLSRPCNEECVVYEYIKDDWGACKPASEGKCERWRDIECVGTSVNGDAISADDAKCSGDKPAGDKECPCEGEEAVGGNSGEALNLNKAWNMQSSRTEKYRSSAPGKALIVRRGAVVELFVNADRETAKENIKLLVDLDMTGTRKSECKDTLNWDDGDVDYGPYNCADYKRLKWCVDETVKCGTASGWGENWQGDPKSWGAIDNCCSTCQCRGGSIDWSSYWEYVPNANDNKRGTIRITLPADLAIGRFDLVVSIHNTHMPAIDLFILYNPWNNQDETHMSSVVSRQEYIDNTDGLIWVGSHRSNFPFRWRHYQFEFQNLEVVMNTLRRLSYNDLSNIILVARHISYAVNKDICWGRWASKDEEYQQAPSSGYTCAGGDCKKPGYWSNTTELFEIHKKYNKRVQFCQCFVYGGVVTSFGRALGFPTRTVTNFQSAHDYGKNRAIEEFFRWDPSKGTISRGVDAPAHNTGEDSVWNFHVWNEVYFRRNLPDDVKCIDKGNGWQIIDATPQEKSLGGNPACSSHSGCYQCGPAPLGCVRENIDATYDSEFVISEVNAAINMWTSTKDDPEYTLHTEYRMHPWGADEVVGQQISTKSVGTISKACLDWSTSTNCKNELNDVTLKYKKEEPSGPWVGDDQQNRLKEGMKWNADIGRRFMGETNTQDSDHFLEVEWLPPPRILLADNDAQTMLYYGADHSRVDASFRLASFEDDPITIYYVFEVYVQSYNGEHKFLVKEVSDEMKLNAGKEDYLKFSILFDQWKDKLEYDMWTLTVEAELSVNYHDEFLTDVEKFYSADVLICKPERFLDDRVLCENRAIWKKPTYTLKYDCSAAPSASKLGDGKCDIENNLEDCFDMGDCCESTCALCPGEPEGECLDKRTPDYSLVECDDSSEFAKSGRVPTECNIDDCEVFFDTCLDDIMQLKQHHGSISVCLDETRDKLNSTAVINLEKYLECTNHNDTWTPSADELTCNDGFNKVVVRVFAGPYGPDVSWSISNSNCKGGPYPPNGEEMKSCCIPEDASLICEDEEGGGWVDAYVQVGGTKHCQSDFGTTPFGNYTHVSPIKPGSIPDSTITNNESEDDDNMHFFTIAVLVAIGVVLVFLIWWCYKNECKNSSQHAENQSLLHEN